MSKFRYKFIGVFLSTFLTLIAGAYAFEYFFLHKFHQELRSYKALSTQLQITNDAYYICLGLQEQDPSLENIQTCKQLKKISEQKIQYLHKNYPMVNTYLKLFEK